MRGTSAGGSSVCRPPLVSRATGPNSYQGQPPDRRSRHGRGKEAQTRILPAPGKAPATTSVGQLNTAATTADTRKTPSSTAAHSRIPPGNRRSGRFESLQHDVQQQVRVQRLEVQLLLAPLGRPDDPGAHRQHVEERDVGAQDARLLSALGMTCAKMLAAGDFLMERGQKAGVLRADVSFFDVLSMGSGIVWAAERREEKPD